MSRFWEGLVIGGALGYLIGILSAPKSGAELRQQLADNSEDLYKQAADSLGDIREKTNGALSDIQHKGNEVFKKASDSVAETKGQIAHKIQEFTGHNNKVMVDDVESATSG
ncbi:MAG: YtxH domain-containing protein [Candidatus Melainabacteria bacterium]|jgi:gas vesicle protein|nr:YtxH domain-containing protein [Candidatus Melainabacteria bacterium]MBX9674810.1 YtxH domain-containing protein [Candidatus Obscuribacterales bacterium]